MSAEPPICPSLPDVDVLDVFEIDHRGRLVTLEPGRRPNPDPAPTSTRRSRPASQPRPDQPPRRPAGGTAAPPPRLPTSTLGRREVRGARLVDPIEAAERVTDPAMLFDIRGLELASTGPVRDGPTVTLACSIRIGPWRRPVPAEMCVRPSPSWVTTLIEIRPQGRRRRVRGAFVRAGLRVVEELGERLASGADTAHRPESTAAGVDEPEGRVDSPSPDRLLLARE